MIRVRDVLARLATSVEKLEVEKLVEKLEAPSRWSARSGETVRDWRPPPNGQPNGQQMANQMGSQVGGRRIMLWREIKIPGIVGRGLERERLVVRLLESGEQLAQGMSEIRLRPRNKRQIRIFRECRCLGGGGNRKKSRVS